LERNNFIREGFFKEDYFYDGNFLDTAVYSLITAGNW
jgi:RimJ/RimL family protein N-acetyltransferase